MLLHDSVHSRGRLSKLRQGSGAVVLPDPAGSLEVAPVVLLVLQPGVLQHVPGAQPVLGRLHQQLADEVLGIA